MKKRRFRFAALIAAAFLMTAGQCFGAFADTGTLVITGGGPEDSLAGQGPAGETIPDSREEGPAEETSAGITSEETASGETADAGSAAGVVPAETMPAETAGPAEAAAAETVPSETVSSGSASPAAGTLQTPAQAGPALFLLADISTTGSTISMEELTAGSGNASNVSNTGNSGVSSAPEKPEVSAQAAVVYDATHDRFLYEKNADTKLYPASITKVMTALLVSENLSWDDTVIFSESAVTNLEAGAVTLKIGAGDTFTVRDLMYGLWLRSANEVANGFAEKISGSVPAFADKMNQKAVSLGCTNTHFANPNGLNNASHVTTARDMARITNAAFNSSMVRQVASTLTWTFPATSLNPETRTLIMGHKMLNPSNSQHYDGFVGGKTGYTSKAGNTLVSVAERNGVRLVAVVLKCVGTHYTDTKKLFDYGFGTLAAQAPQEAHTAQAEPQIRKSFPVSPGGSINGGRWVSEGSRWRFLKSNDSFAGSESIRINGQVYTFGADGYMLSGWQRIGNAWYHFRDSGELHTPRWLLDNGNWRYVDENGAMVTSGTTPDGYTVDANGVWIS